MRFFNLVLPFFNLIIIKKNNNNMLYINKAIDNVIITDNVINTIINNYEIKIGDEIIGTYSNLSEDINYIKIEIPSAFTENLNTVEQTINFSQSGTTIKEEFITVKDTRINEPIINFNKTKIKDKYYERKY
jgi:hypothetical protein